MVGGHCSLLLRPMMLTLATAAVATDQRTLAKLVHLSMRLGLGRQLVIDPHWRTRVTAAERSPVNRGGRATDGEV